MSCEEKTISVLITKYVLSGPLLGYGGGCWAGLLGLRLLQLGLALRVLDLWVPGAVRHAAAAPAQPRLRLDGLHQQNLVRGDNPASLARARVLPQSAPCSHQYWRY